uniref:NADH dehydrogenase subunit 6 n=1 Tax=Lepetodrilus schrolli TaxID=205510 RepID=A0A0S1F5N0_9VEST|nr:NADH dehydrogenase subunit 6 [Lepetodrilus schrolli]
MSLSIMLSMCLAILFLMPLMLQPLSLGLCIMLLTGALCLLASLSASSWYAYILFLVFVGGLLVMFAYVAVLAPNTFFLNFKPMIWMSMIFMVSLVIMSTVFFKNPLSIAPPSSHSASLLDSSSTGANLVFMNSTSIMIILGTILLIALLAVVKICYYQQGPLRTHSYPSE